MEKLGVIASVAVGFSLFSAVALASAVGGGITADQALNNLLDGNRRYVENSMNACTSSTATAREKLATGQQPFAVILCCSDSRVPPEIIFDKSLGEIFVVRDAGNVADPLVLGSIEYGVEHLGAPLIMVLGHERCGAVMATVDAKGKGEGNIGAIINAIAPALSQARNDKNCDLRDKGKLVECVVDTNVRMVAKNLMKQSKIIRELVHQGKVKIVAAKYDLDNGKVTVFTAGN
jgi:carbonic anhydrase